MFYLLDDSWALGKQMIRLLNSKFCYTKEFGKKFKTVEDTEWLLISEHKSSFKL